MIFFFLPFPFGRWLVGSSQVMPSTLVVVVAAAAAAAGWGACFLVGRSCFKEGSQVYPIIRKIASRASLGAIDCQRGTNFFRFRLVLWETMLVCVGCSRVLGFGRRKWKARKGRNLRETCLFKHHRQNRLATNQWEWSVPGCHVKSLY